MTRDASGALSAARGRPLPRFVRLALLLAIALVAAVPFLPLAPYMPAPGLDPGWAYGMNHAIQARFVIGTDVVFTFGPYAFLYTVLYTPGLVGLHFFGTSILFLAYILALAALSGQTRHPVLSSTAGLLLTVFLAFGIRDAILLCLPLLYLFLCRGKGETGRVGAAALGLLAVALALLTLTKGSLALAAIAVLGTGLVVGASHGRPTRGALPILVYALALPACWLLAGQDLGALPNFLSTSLEIIRGYTEAMTLAGPAWQPALYCAGAAALLLANRHRFGTDLPSLATFLGTGALLFLAFKAGFVRHDGHALIAGDMLPIVALAFTLIGPVRRGPWVGLGIALLAWGAISDHWREPTDRPLLSTMAARVETTVTALANRLRHPGWLDARYEAALADIRAARPMPHVEGTADAYSYDQSALLAHGIAWSPRPVIQSYSAYTSRLAELNAAHLLGPHAPDNVFIRIDNPVDHRLEALEDGASWPILLSHYAPGRMVAGTAVLHRLPANQVRPLAMTPISTRRYDMGEAVPLPPEPVWARVNVRPTLAGRLVSLLFRPPTLRIVLQFPDGHEERRRFVAAVAPAGFLVSPFVRTTTDFVGLGLQADYFHANQRPTAFRIEGEELPHFIDLFWQRQIAVELQAVALPTHPQARRLFGIAPELVEASLPPVAPAGACNLDMASGRQASQDSLRTTGSIDLAGWGHVSAPRRQRADQMALLLTRGDGTTFRVPVERMDRPDVAAYFQQADLAASGFHARVDLAGMPGDYALAIEVTSAEGSEVCRLHSAPLRVGP